MYGMCKGKMHVHLYGQWLVDLFVYRLSQKVKEDRQEKRLSWFVNGRGKLSIIYTGVCPSQMMMVVK